MAIPIKIDTNTFSCLCNFQPVLLFKDMYNFLNASVLLLQKKRRNNCKTICSLFISFELSRTIIEFTVTNNSIYGTEIFSFPMRNHMISWGTLTIFIPKSILVIWKNQSNFVSKFFNPIGLHKLFFKEYFNTHWWILISIWYIQLDD